MSFTTKTKSQRTVVPGSPPLGDRSPLRQSRRGMPPWAVMVSIAWLVALMAGAVLLPVLPLPDPGRSDYAAIMAPMFSPGHLLGTDEVGRDILARLLSGAQVSLFVGIASIALAVVLGAPMGIIAGYFGGWTNRVIVAGLDIVLSFPSLVALIALSLFLGPGLWTIVVGIGLIASAPVARVARSATLTFVNRDFVTAARGMGFGHVRILTREILPNVVVPVLAYAMVVIAVAIVAESSLSFLGLGIQPPNASWGSMMGTGRAKLTQAPHIVLMPALTMAISILAINFLSEHFAKRFDIKESAL
ncbi:ABC transporter permease [Homoserinimonas hongtaonis]|uniref:ABC transporter permease n=1 Tax=Homoserinimonas hongtaonis TaxID=2079791 RepID=UPI000D37F06A|nr:ABC transporter permease [Salinibacterium hongtaonis]AWB90218.1 hypothetical protein C2138_12270 [Salinibacterium hongtaonis]